MRNTKKLFISGGGTEKDSAPLDKKFVDALALKKVLYIPIALDGDEIGFEACYDWIISALSPHSKEFIDIVMLLDLADKSPNLSDFGGVYIGGGNTYKLLQLFYDSGFDKDLRRFLGGGGIVYGGSAGAIIFGESIEIVSEENDKNYKYSRGLSLIKNYSVACHYDPADDKKIRQFVVLHRSPVIALPEGVGLIIGEDGAGVVGNSDVIIFNPIGERERVKTGGFIDRIRLEA